jgi:hypothetical protein
MTFLDCPILTLDEFQQLVSPFKAAAFAIFAGWLSERRDVA